MGHNFLPRLGTFFILIGIALLLLFAASFMANQLASGLPYLVYAAAAFFLGSLLRRTAHKPEPTRFSAIRKVSQRSRQKQEEKNSRKEQQQ